MRKYQNNKITENNETKIYYPNFLFFWGIILIINLVVPNNHEIMQKSYPSPANKIASTQTVNKEAEIIIAESYPECDVIYAVLKLTEDINVEDVKYISNLEVKSKKITDNICHIQLKRNENSGRFVENGIEKDKIIIFSKKDGSKIIEAELSA